jgi:hypothetical protein
MESLGLAEAEARKRLKQIDANRPAYIRQVCGHDWRQLGDHDMVLDNGPARAVGAQTPSADLSSPMLSLYPVALFSWRRSYSLSSPLRRPRRTTLPHGVA